jgi:peptide deformylase
LSKEEILSPEIQNLVQDMVDTMHDASGIGLAAPQIYESLAIAVLEFQADNARYPDMGEQSLLVLFNPKITVLDETEQSFWEGCLSVPDIRGLVHRPRKIAVDYLDLEAKPKRIEAEGFLATVFQHELDHLFGRLYIDLVRDTKNIAFLEEFRRFKAVKPGEEVD